VSSVLSPYGVEILRLKRLRSRWASGAIKFPAERAGNIRDLTHRINHIARRASSGVR
jgi:hypothetical protein